MPADYLEPARQAFGHYRRYNAAFSETWAGLPVETCVVLFTRAYIRWKAGCERNRRRERRRSARRSKFLAGRSTGCCSVASPAKNAPCDGSCDDTSTETTSPPTSAASACSHCYDGTVRAAVSATQTGPSGGRRLRPAPGGERRFWRDPTGRRCPRRFYRTGVKNTVLCNSSSPKTARPCHAP